MYFRFRFLCKALAGYVLAQLPERRGEPQSVRCFAGASGPVGQPGGNSECAKVLLKLDAGVAELKPHVELALKQVSHPHTDLIYCKLEIIHLPILSVTSYYFSQKF